MKNRIKEMRKQLELSMDKVAEGAGTTRATIMKLENGDMGLTTKWMERIAKALGCNPEDLISEQNTKPIPIRGFVPGGCPSEAIDTHVEEYVNYPVRGNAKNYYALRVDGDSMNNVVADGSYVIVDITRRNALELDGKLVIAHCNGDCTFKRLCLNPNILMPDSANKSHKPILLTPEWEILGVVVGSISNLED